MATFEDVFQTIKNGDFDKFKELIECEKSFLQYIDDEGNNLLMIFLKRGTNIVRIFDIKISTYRNHIIKNYIPNDDILEYIISSGIDLNNFNNNDENVLMISYYWYWTYHKPDIIEILIKNGADPFLKNKETSCSFEEYLFIQEGNNMDLVKYMYQDRIEKQKQYYEQKLIEQKEQLLDELYRPDGLGYTVAKERFEKND